MFEYLREHVTTDIAAAHIVIDGGSVVLCDGDELVDVLKNGPGRAQRAVARRRAARNSKPIVAPTPIETIDIDTRAVARR